MKKLRTIGICIVGLGLTYNVIETRYFGSHWFPSSDAEVLADGIALVITSIGLLAIGLAARK